MGKREPQLLERHFSAGGVVFREKNQVEWLVAKAESSKLTFKGIWRLPKGWLDDTGEHSGPGPLTLGTRKATEEELQQAALREVEEEGGVEAEILTKIGTVRHFSKNLKGEKVLKFTTLYLMKWKRDLPEGPGWETEKVEWLPFTEAVKRLTFAHEKEVLKKAKEILERETGETLV